GPLLTDFNTRCFRELAFDGARGMPLALMMHALASGEDERLVGLAASAEAADGARDVVWIDLIDVWRSRLVRRGPSSAAATARTLRRGRPAVDPFFSRSDPVPGLVRASAHLKGFAVQSAVLASRRMGGAGLRSVRRHTHR